MQNLYEQWIKNTTTTTIPATLSTTTTATTANSTINTTSTSSNDFLNSSQNEKNNWLNSSLNLPPEQRLVFFSSYIFFISQCLFSTI